MKAQLDIVTITPAMAQTWLSKFNGHNRRLRPTALARYTRDMAGGQWQFNGDAIRFGVGPDGHKVLLDGQHRLQACVDSGVSFTTVVISRLPVEAQATVDIGATRVVADVLTLRGQTNATMLGAVARWTVALQHGKVVTSYNPTHAETLAFIEKNDDIFRAVEVAVRAHSRKTSGHPSVIGALYFICARVDRMDAEIFWAHQLVDGFDVSPGDPAAALRIKLTDKPHPNDILRFGVTAWNHFRDGRKVTVLRSPRGGWTAKNLPTAR